MWTHFCPVKRIEVAVEFGDPCRTCGMAQPNQALQQERLRTSREDLLVARLSLHRTARQHVALSALIGLIGVAWALEGLTQPLGSSNPAWMFVMLLVGLLQVFGVRSRHWRHIGFFLGMLVWASAFGMYLISHTLVPIMGVPFTLAAFCAGAYADEVFSRIKYAIGVPYVFFAS